MDLNKLNIALGDHGWFAEWVSREDDDRRVMLYRPQGGQAHDRFDFDPSDPDDNSPWEHNSFPAAYPAVEKALQHLCSEAQE